MPIEQRRRGARTNSTNARIAILSIPDEREEIGNELRLYTELRAHCLGVPDLHPLPDNLHNAVTAHALPEVLVVRPNANLVDARVFRGKSRRRGKT